MLIEFIGRILGYLALLSIPLIAIVGILTEKKFQNPFVILIIVFSIYVGARAWKTKRKLK